MTVEREFDIFLHSYVMFWSWGDVKFIVKEALYASIDDVKGEAIIMEESS